MLFLTQVILQKIETEFCQVDCERGGILGCSENLDIIDYFCPIPALQSNRYSYTPDIKIANQVIAAWRRDGICFIGFIHSHIVNKPYLSEGDIHFAKMIYQNFHMPYIWFGLAVIYSEKISVLFFKVCKLQTKIVMEEETYTKLKYVEDLKEE